MRRDYREAETLSIAKEANRLASEATNWARWAEIIATVAAIFAAKDAIVLWMFG